MLALLDRLTRLVAGAGGVLYSTRSRSLARGGPVLHHQLPGRRVARPAVRPGRGGPAAPPGGHGRRVARSLRRRPRGLGARRRPAGLRGGGLRGLLLLGPGGRVRHRGDGEQHPGRVPGLRDRDPPVRGHRGRAGVQRRQPRPGGGDVRGGRAAGEVLRADPAPRTARALRDHRGRRRGARGRVGDHRPRRSHPARRAGRAGPPLGGDRAGVGAGLRGGRHDRGLRHPLRTADRAAGRHRRRRRRRVLGLRASCSGAGPPHWATREPSGSTRCSSGSEPGRGTAGPGSSRRCGIRARRSP